MLPAVASNTSNIVKQNNRHTIQVEYSLPAAEEPSGSFAGSPQFPGVPIQPFARGTHPGAARTAETERTARDSVENGPENAQTSPVSETASQAERRLIPSHGEHAGRPESPNNGDFLENSTNRTEAISLPATATIAQTETSVGHPAEGPIGPTPASASFHMEKPSGASRATTQDPLRSTIPAGQ